MKLCSILSHLIMNQSKYVYRYLYTLKDINGLNKTHITSYMSYKDAEERFEFDPAVKTWYPILDTAFEVPTDKDLNTYV